MRQETISTIIFIIIGVLVIFSYLYEINSYGSAEVIILNGAEGGYIFIENGEEKFISSNKNNSGERPNVPKIIEETKKIKKK